MKRPVLVVGLTVLAVTGLVLVEQRLEKERAYRALLSEGEVRLAGRDYSAAIEAFSGAVALRPTSMVAYLRRGETYAAEHRSDEAIRDLRRAAALSPDSTAPDVALGDLYADAEPAQAADWYGQAAARLKDQDPALLYKLARADYRAGWPAAAVDPLQRAIARDDAVGEAHYLLALAYRDTQRPADAVRSLERAVKVDPSLLAARSELAEVYRAAGRPADEVAQLEALVALDPRADRMIALALAESRGGQFDAAVATLSEAERRLPGAAHVPLALGRVYLTRADRTRSREDIALALKTLQASPDPESDRAERGALLGRAMFLSGNWPAAERLLEDDVRGLPVDPEAFGFLADVAERLGDDRTARDALVRLDVLEGDTASLSTRASRARRLGVLSLGLHDAPAAVASLTQAVDAGLQDAPTLALLTQARWESGDAIGARDTLARGLARDPHDPDLLRLARLVK